MKGPARGTLRLTSIGRSALALGLAGLVLTMAVSDLEGLHMLPVGPALLLVALAVSPLLAWLQMRGLRLGPAPARTVFAGESFVLRPVLENRSGLFAVRDLVLGAGDGVRGHTRPLAYLPRLATHALLSADCPWRLPRRGRTSECTLTAASSFPFGLVERRLVFLAATDLLALPRLGTLREIAPLLRPAAGSRRRRTATRQGSEEFFGLRDWREGESPHLVHWKTSARRGRPVVRELEGEDRPAVRLVLSGFVPAPHAADRPHASFERAVGLTATLLEYLLRRRHRVSLAFAGEQPFERRLGPTRGALLAALADLACVQPVARRRPVSERALFERARRRGELALLVDAGAVERVELAGMRSRRGCSRGLVLHVDHPALSEIYTTTRRGQPRAALLWT